MEDPAARLSFADFAAARGRFFDRVMPTIPPAPACGGLILEEADMDPFRAPVPSEVPALETAWCSRWPEEVAACFTPDGVRHQMALPEGRFQGRAAIAQAVGRIMHAVPDSELEVVRTARAADAVVLEWVLTGTHVNDCPGLPARGARLQMPGVSVCRMDGGLIREERVYWDAATLMAQAGLMPRPPQ